MEAKPIPSHPLRRAAGPAASSTASGSSAIEEALADAEDRGQSARRMARLEGILADPAIGRDDRGRVGSPSSRLVEKLGDKDRAVSLRRRRRRRRLSKDAEKQLATLLGKSLPSPWTRRGKRSP